VKNEEVQLVTKPVQEVEQDPVKLVVSRVSRTKTLDLRGDKSYSSEQLTEIFSSLKDLRICYFNGVSQDLSCLAENCPRLTFLDLSKNSLTDEDLISLAQHCKNLKYLNLSDCTGLKGEGVAALVKANPNLEFLILDRCTGITAESHKEIAAATGKLNMLSLNGLNEQAFVSLKTYLHANKRIFSRELDLEVGLTHLGLQGFAIDDALLKEIAEICPSLELLDIIGSQATLSGFHDPEYKRLQFLKYLFLSPSDHKTVDMGLITRRKAIEEVGVSDGTFTLYKVDANSNVQTSNQYKDGENVISAFVQQPDVMRAFAE
jgi:hypothetical protein